MSRREVGRNGDKGDAQILDAERTEETPQIRDESVAADQSSPAQIEVKIAYELARKMASAAGLPPNSRLKRQNQFPVAPARARRQYAPILSPRRCLKRGRSCAVREV
jgi:hypothetical protein